MKDIKLSGKSSACFLIGSSFGISAKEAYQKYKLVKLIDKDNFICNVEVDHKKRIFTQGKIQNDFYYPLSEDEIKNIIANMDDKSIPSVMKHFKANYAGKVDMGLVNQVARSL